MSLLPNRNWIFVGLALTMPVIAAPASAEEFRPEPGDVTLRAGPAGILFDSSAKLQVLGFPMAGADLTASDSLTASVEAEIYVVNAVSLSVTVGIPPKSQVDGKGLLAPAGRLGSVRYGLGGALVKYHFNQDHPFQPFVGAGVSHFVSFKEYDAAVSALNVGASWGPLVQGGAEYMLNEHVGIYASASYSWLKTNGSGTFGGLPITARVTLNPTALQGGVLYRF